MFGMVFRQGQKGVLPVFFYSQPNPSHFSYVIVSKKTLNSYEKNFIGFGSCIEFSLT